MTQKELKNIGQEILKEHGLSNSKIKFKNIERGWASYTTTNISIPKWTLQRHKSYALYYVLHEVSHQIINKKFDSNIIKPHGKEFKELEKQLLARYNIRPVYSRAYVKELYDSKTNKLIYKQKRA